MLDIGVGELQVAGRHEIYSDFCNTTKPKFAGKIRFPANRVLNVILRVGSGLTPGQPDGESPSTHGAIDVHEVFWKLLLASAVIVVAARALGIVFRRIGQ